MVHAIAACEGSVVGAGARGTFADVFQIGGSAHKVIKGYGVVDAPMQHRTFRLDSHYLLSAQCT